MPSWLRKALSRANTEALDVQSGKSRTTKPDASKSPDGEKPLLKTSTDYGMYHPVAKHGQPELIPVWISTYNLDWDELLPFLKQVYKNHEFPESVSRISVHLSPCACVLTWLGGAADGGRGPLPDLRPHKAYGRKWAKSSLHCGSMLIHARSKMQQLNSLEKSIVTG